MIALPDVLVPVALVSPYSGDIERNTRYARACMRDCLSRGEAPFPSHMLYPQVLEDARAEERALGMLAGRAWWSRASLAACYTDLGLSPGMVADLEWCAANDIVVERRTIGGWS